MIGALANSVLPAVIQGGMQMWSANSVKQGAERANDMNYQMFRENLDFQKWAMGNKHQLEVADLRAAGLNPILSANTAGSLPGGAGYSAPQNENAGFAELNAHSADSIAKITSAVEAVKQLKVETEVKEATKDAQIATQKAIATTAAVNSAKALIQAQFNNSKLGRGTIKFNQFLKNVLGRNN